MDVQSKQRQLEKGFAPYIINILNNLFMKKKVITLSCIAAVAIATFVGTKAFQSNAYENGLLNQNVEALSQGDVPTVWIPCAIDNNTCYLNFVSGSGSGTMPVSGHRNI